MKTYFCILIMFCLTAFGFAQTIDSTNNVVLCNKGALSVAVNSGGNAALLYVGGAVKADSVTQITCNGDFKVRGSFFHNATTNVFKVDADGKGVSTGNVVFVGESGSQKRYIAPSSDTLLAAGFNRALYAAFPNISINTDDTVVLPAKMGIDATTITSSSGKLLLKSAKISSKVYDASLRVTGAGAGASADYVDAGAVIIEKWVAIYRTGTQLFGFATPFDNTQKAGYFAGNWVRVPSQDDNFHTKYVMADSTINGTDIAQNQYVRDANEKLQAGRAYLIKPRPSNFDYSELESNGGLYETADAPSAYDKDCFVFNGSVYTITPYSEQLFAADTLPAYKLNSATQATTNWLFGNSYTSAISIEKLYDKIANSNYYFYSTMYYFPAGSTSWVGHTIGLADAIITWPITEIPAMSVFMLRLKDQSANAERFQFGKDDLVHSTVDYGQTSQSAPARSNAPVNSGLNNQVIFRLTMAENENNFDLAAIGIRQNATLAGDNYDIAKVYTSDNAGFQLYTLSSADTKLSANGVPFDVEQVAMNLKPMANETQTMILNVQGIETLSSEDFWLEDLQAAETHRFVNGEPYVFTTTPEDAQERFIVHFKAQAPQEPTGAGNDVDDAKPNVYTIDKQIFIENILQSDLGKDVEIMDITGRIIDNFKVNNYPKMNYFVKNIPVGIYIVRLNGTKILKTIIK